MSEAGGAYERHPESASGHWSLSWFATFKISVVICVINAFVFIFTFI